MDKRFKRIVDEIFGNEKVGFEVDGTMESLESPYFTFFYGAPVPKQEKEEVFEIEMPGYTKENVSVDWTGKHLIVEGTCTRQGKEKKFSKAFRLGFVPIRPDLAAASLENGILTITFPLPESDKPEPVNRKIPIE